MDDARGSAPGPAGGPEPDAAEDRATPAAAGGEPPYLVVDRPGPGLGRIADRRDGTTGLWSRALRGKRPGLPRPRCANCGMVIAGPFYRPPLRTPPRRPLADDRLCPGCVEGSGPGAG